MAMDVSGWPVEQQVDWHLVRAEMNGMDFNIRVLKSWARDPAFYQSVWTYQSDTPAHEGPTHHALVEIWTYAFPLDAAAEAKLTAELNTIPPLLEQARANLTGNARELWLAGIKHIEDQERDLRRTLYQWRHLPGDMIVNDFIACPLAIHSTDFGIIEDVEVVKTDDANDIVSREFHIQIRDVEDLEKIRMPVVTHNEAATEFRYAAMCEVYDGIMPVKKVGQTHVWYTPWDYLVRWWGVQEAMMDLVQRPALVHAVGVAQVQVERLEPARVVPVVQVSAFVALQAIDRFHRPLAAIEELPERDEAEIDRGQIGQKREADVGRAGAVRDLLGQLGHAGRMSVSADARASVARDFDAAAALLGRPFRMEGHVVRGAGLGRKLNYPTANLHIRAQPSPVGGVLAAFGRIGRGRWRPAVTNVGRRPAVGGLRRICRN